MHRGLVRSGDRGATEEIFRLVKSNQAEYRIATMCSTLGVSASGYYAWLSRDPSARKRSDLEVGDRIESIHRRSRNTYGRPRIKAELRELGQSISNDRLPRLMRERKLQGASRRKGIRTTVRDRDARPAPDLVDRKFNTDAPNKLLGCRHYVHSHIRRLSVPCGRA